jgi:hypothetical protein
MMTLVGKLSKMANWNQLLDMSDRPYAHMNMNCVKICPCVLVTVQTVVVTSTCS